ncbi:MAG: bifunctional phosphoribosyl-AMP cyclohydrolase/phosphoribosyl-ATP diphosphatase HisIE [Acidobacteria bacterium]|nr:bifunctional phosphoribosyl-AMP cyclohydrolase/phosphoribosyl-ATP diphosphatase HisIE [Acidobacteriota bacterium]
MFDPESLSYDAQGLIPAIVQTPAGEVRMLAWMNREAVEKTLASRRVTFWSRSRRKLWTKGEESGHVLRLCGLSPDCDRDALLVTAEPEGPTCHTGSPSCFDGEGATAPLPWLGRLEALLQERKASASMEGSYTQKLFARGPGRIAKKVVEEAGEAALAAQKLDHARTPGHRTDFLEEAADLLFHLELLLVSQGLGLADAVAVLQRRHVERAAPVLVKSRPEAPQSKPGTRKPKT